MHKKIERRKPGCSLLSAPFRERFENAYEVLGNSPCCQKRRQAAGSRGPPQSCQPSPRKSPPCCPSRSCCYSSTPRPEFCPLLFMSKPHCVCTYNSGVKGDHGRAGVGGFRPDSRQTFSNGAYNSKGKGVSSVSWGAF